jgi:hypothetical protein
MPTTRHLAIVVSALILSPCLSAAEPQTPPKPPAAPPATAQFTRPVLIAIAWASPEVQPTTDPPIGNSLIAWRPDGTAIPAAELASIKKELREFGALGKVEPQRLPPLHLVFRIDAKATNSQRLIPSLVIGDRPLESLALQEGSSANRLALSVLTVAPGAIPRWPAEIDVEVRVPNEEGQVFQTVKELKDAPLNPAPGLRLFWTKVATMDRAGQKILPAVALQTDRMQTVLVDYDFFTHLTDGTTHSFNAFQAGETHDLRVSPPLDRKEDLDRIDLWRVRYRTELYDRLPIFPERIPKGS